MMPPPSGSPVDMTDLEFFYEVAERSYGNPEDVRMVLMWLIAFLHEHLPQKGGDR